jgi:hypothetical protein
MADAATTRDLRRKRRRQSLLMLGAGLLLTAGVVAAVVRFAPDKDAAPETSSTVPAVVPTTQTPAKLPEDAKRVARRFVQTAVARKHLAESYDLVSPNLRGGLTREEWLTGNIPVIPYPVESLSFAPFKVDYAYTDEALIEVALLPKEGVAVKPQIFSLVLKKVGPNGGKHWVVDLWTPRGSPLVPQGNG